MWERLKHIGPSVFASTLFWAFIFYLGSRIGAGERMEGDRGIMRWIAEGLNALADGLGPQVFGYGVMTAAIFGAVFTAVLLWRSPWF